MRQLVNFLNTEVTMDCRCLLISIALLLIALPLYGQYALEFDGVDDYAEVPHDSTLEFGSQITVEIWFFVDAIPTSTQQFFHKKVAGVYSTFTFLFRNGDLLADVSIQSSYEPLAILGEAIPIGVWNHVAITCNGAVLRLYLNGYEWDNEPVSGYILNEPTPVSFGRYDEGFGQYFDGSLDEARLWNVARTGDEIRFTMNMELTGFEEGLVGYWKFNEGFGDSIFDSTPNMNDGQLGSSPGSDPSDPTWIPREFPPATVDLVINPTGPTTIPQGGILYFNTHIQNNRKTTVEGDLWFSVLMPDSSELLIPEILLNYPNPLHGQIFPYGFVDLSNEFWVHPRADTGSYQLIGRIGQYPNGIVDEESFEFHVIE